MHLVRRALVARISSTIILPYLLLVFCTAVVIAIVSVRLTISVLQERVDQRLIESAQATHDTLVGIEDQQLAQLRLMAFTEGVPQALQAQDRAELTTLLTPYWVNSGLYTLIAVDQAGRPIISWERAPNTTVNAPPRQVQHTDLPSWWLVQQVIGGQQDVFGDKFSAFHDGHFYTAAPIKLNGRIVGGMLVGLPMDQMLERLQRANQARVTTFYDSQGRAVATTQVLVDSTLVPAIPAPVLARFQSAAPQNDAMHVQHVGEVNGREYQFVYDTLQIRRATTGFLSVALPRQFLLQAWAHERWLLITSAILLVLAALSVGLWVARRITRPLRNLVTTAQAVTHGELSRRSTINSANELGVLAHAFNHMTERLLHLYTTSRTLSEYTSKDALLEQAYLAVQPIVPAAAVVVVLETDDGWHMYAYGHDPLLIAPLHHRTLQPNATIANLISSTGAITVSSASAGELHELGIPQGFCEACYTGLIVQDKPFGLLLLLHTQADAFPIPVHAPLTAVARMLTTALYNARLYAAVQTEGDWRRVILESIADGVLVCDAQRNIVLMNHAAERLLHIHDWQHRRYHFTDLPLTPLSDGHPLLSTDGRAEERYEAYGQVLRTSSAPLASASHVLTGEVIVIQNISEQVALDAAKTDLIALISHELRTPLTSILSANDMLAKGIGGQLAPLQLELVNTALRQSHAMNTLIEKATIMATIEAGTLELNVQPLHLRSVIDPTLHALETMAKAIHVDLQIDLPDDLPLAHIDARLVKVAIQQVVDNAIKYGCSPITIGAHVGEDGIEITIRDHGPGISAAELPHLFRRLQRSKDSLNKEPRGLGLGLVITREVIERQGGRVAVQSEAGHGSQFSIILPASSHVATPIAI